MKIHIRIESHLCYLLLSLALFLRSCNAFRDQNDFDEASTRDAPHDGGNVVGDEIDSGDDNASMSSDVVYILIFAIFSTFFVVVPSRSALFCLRNAVWSFFRSTTIARLRRRGVDVVGRVTNVK